MFVFVKTIYFFSNQSVTGFYLFQRRFVFRKYFEGICGLLPLEMSGLDEKK
jgi:hypothetical protein